MDFVVIQNCPVPAKMAAPLRRILRRSGATLQSAYRGEDAKALLHRLGKHTQKELFDCFQAHVPGCNPANAPGFSTHELFNDGVAYTRKSWPRGHRLPWWCIGLDVDDAHVKAFIREARREGFKVSVTYPANPREAHHVNFRRPPLLVLAKALLRK